MTDLDTMAAWIRSQCIAGFDWFLPKCWADVPESAKNAWRNRAEMEIAPPPTRMDTR